MQGRLPASFVISAGGAPPRSQCRRLAARDTRGWRTAASRSGRGFVEQYSLMFTDEAAYLTLIADFERRVVESGFMTTLQADIVDHGAEANSGKSVLKSARCADGSGAQDSQRRVRACADATPVGSVSPDRREPQDSQTPPSEPSIQNAPDANTGKHDSNLNSGVSRSEFPQSPESRNRSGVLLAKRHTHLAQARHCADQRKAADRRLDKAVGALRPRHIRLTDWGMRRIKRQFELDRLPIEDLSLDDKRGLSQAVHTLAGNPRTAPYARYVTYNLTREPSSMKQWLRQLGVFVRLVPTLSGVRLSAETKVAVVNTMYKLEALIEFVRDKFLQSESVDASLSGRSRQRLL